MNIIKLKHDELTNDWWDLIEDIITFKNLKCYSRIKKTKVSSLVFFDDIKRDCENFTYNHYTTTNLGNFRTRFNNLKPYYVCYTFSFYDDKIFKHYSKIFASNGNYDFNLLIINNSGTNQLTIIDSVKTFKDENGIVLEGFTFLLEDPLRSREWKAN